jgi:hypothetical protein
MLSKQNYIASGFYYHVYRVAEARVHKVPTSFVYKAWRLLWWRMVPLSHLYKEILDIPRWTYEQVEMTRTLLEEFPNTALLGNPSPIAVDGSYDQDYAPSIGTLAVADDIFNARVRAYVGIQHMLWAYGFSERVWNFTFNCGVLPHSGTVILTDLNELTRDKALVHAHITQKKWDKQNTLRLLRRSAPLRAAAASHLITSTCTHEVLDEVWGTENTYGKRP